MPDKEPVLGHIKGSSQPEWRDRDGNFFDEDDFLLIAMLQDPILMAELLWSDPNNAEYGGAYTVRSHQYRLFRPKGWVSGEHRDQIASGRAVGKTEGIKAWAASHAFRRSRANLLITAPERIHLDPLTREIEDRIKSTRMLRDFLDTDSRTQKTGITHMPFGVDFADGTKLVGRIPQKTGPQPLHEKILTPTGWITMREVMNGDLVIGSEGKPVKVLGVTNAWEGETYEVEFTDGTTVETDGRHQWTVSSPSSPMWRTKSTLDIMADLASSNRKESGAALNMWRIPPTPAVEYGPPPDTPPLDPYIVGALLGDGAISGKGAVLIAHDDEVRDEVERRLPAGCLLTPVNGKTRNYRIVGPDRHKPNPALWALRDLGLLGLDSHQKFIPDRYRFGSHQERLDLIRGLLDTDGTVKQGGGAASLVLGNRTMVNQAAELVRSLGGWASEAQASYRKPSVIVNDGKEYPHPGGTYWRATLRLRGENLFHLSRKAATYTTGKKTRHKSIRSVKPTGKRELVRCIQVDADDGLYVTSGCNITHNSGVKGMHQPDMVIDEAQDYPERGWVEIEETIMQEFDDWSVRVYGVHSGNRASTFYEMARKHPERVTNVTRLQAPDWGPKQKQDKIDQYGSTTSPEYQRNILGVASDAASEWFTLHRLMMCIDQGPANGDAMDSAYNSSEYQSQTLRGEEFDLMADVPVGSVLDLPAKFDDVYVGMDVGLNKDPTVISLWSEGMYRFDSKDDKRQRLKLLRRYNLERFRPKDIRGAIYAIAWHCGSKLKAVGVDGTGMGEPMFKEMEDDPDAPGHLADILYGWKFNELVPVYVNPEFVQKDATGRMRDQYGSTVKVETDQWGNARLVVEMPMVEAATKFLREWVDDEFLMLPFDTEITADLQGETVQRVKYLSGARKKPHSFHILDSFRAMAMGKMQAPINEMLAEEDPDDMPPLAMVWNEGGGGGMEMDYR